MFYPGSASADTKSGDPSPAWSVTSHAPAVSEPVCRKHSFARSCVPDSKAEQVLFLSSLISWQLLQRRSSSFPVLFPLGIPTGPSLTDLLGKFWLTGPKPLLVSCSRTYVFSPPRLPIAWQDLLAYPFASCTSHFRDCPSSDTSSSLFCGDWLNPRFAFGFGGRGLLVCFGGSNLSVLYAVVFCHTYRVNFKMWIYWWLFQLHSSQCLQLDPCALQLSRILHFSTYLNAL